MTTDVIGDYSTWALRAASAAGSAVLPRPGVVFDRL
jgi:hypothetical protein